MTGLPKTLEPWRDALDLFPRDIAMTVGPWLPQLDSLLGPLRSRHSTGSGEPDGFIGLTRRGPYERLLTTEWLLALEIPDEFARRAAMGEHAFYELARRKPAGSVRSFALFDSGPTQIGGPRVVQLALLIVLHARAAREGAAFRWGILQDPALELHEDLSKLSVLELLRARTTQSTNQRDIDCWRQMVDSGGAPDDLWIIGGPSTTTMVSDVSTASLTDRLEPGLPKIDLRVRRGPRDQRDVELMLPPARACVRLLRNPFEVKSTPKPPQRRVTKHGHWASLVFPQSRRYLITRTTDGDTIAYPIPDKAGSQVGLPRVLKTGDPFIIAAGAYRRRLYTVSSDGLRLRITELSQRGRPRWSYVSAPIPAHIPFWHPGKDVPIQLCLFIRRGSDKGAIIFTDAGDRLYRLAMRADAEIELIAGGVKGLARASGYAVAVLDQDDATPTQIESPRAVIRIDATSAPEQIMSTRFDLNTGEGDLTSFFGHRNGMANEFAPVDLLAVRYYDTAWAVYDSYRNLIHTSPDDVNVIGCNGGVGSPARLIALDDDQRTFIGHSATDRKILLSAELPVTNAAVSPAAPLLAYTTSAALVVCSLETYRPLLRVERSEPE